MLLRTPIDSTTIILRGHKSKHLEQRQRQLHLNNTAKKALYIDTDVTLFDKNIEYLIGTTKVPLGVIGPLKINGDATQERHMIPLSTTESALLASYHRGTQLISKEGGCSAKVLEQGISRVPAFCLKDMDDTLRLKAWIERQSFRDLVNSSSGYVELLSITTKTEANTLYLVCEYTTSEAAGQNMVTLATQQIFEEIIQHAEVEIVYAFVESNLSGDKKASASSLYSHRGKKVSAEIVLSGENIERYLHTDARTMQKYWQISAIAGVMSGSVGIQGHYANGLAALYLATGQDIACVAESAIGITRFELCGEDLTDLYVSVTLPNVILGTVGGGTKLPSQAAALEILELPEQNSTQAFAEITAGLILAGEISIIGSLCANDFTKAHTKRSREKKETL